MAEKPRRVVPITQSALAQIAKCSRQAVSKQIKAALSVGLLSDGMVDSAHPAVAAWLKSRTDPAPTQPTKLAAPDSSAPPTPRKSGPKRLALPTEDGPTERIRAQFPDDGTAGAMDSLLDLRLRDFEAEGSTNKEALGWVDLKKRIEEVRKLRLDNDDTEGKIIHRDGAITHVLQLIDLVFNRLLGDVPRTLTSTVSSATKSGTPAEEIERNIRDVISGALRDLKTASIKRLLDK